MPDMIEPEICNAAALRQAARHVSAMYDEALAPAGIGLNQFSILMKLQKTGPISIQGLAGYLVTDRSTLGHLLRPLERRGLVRILVSRDDRRSRELTLTKTGEATLSQCYPLWAAAQRRFEQTIGKEASQRLRKSLKKVAKAQFD